MGGGIFSALYACLSMRILINKKRPRLMPRSIQTLILLYHKGDGE
nr:MAG TPA: hypothetical protein [Caudoviricetes sp.]